MLPLGRHFPGRLAASFLLRRLGTVFFLVMRLRNFLDDPSDRKPNRRLNKYADANHEGTPYHKDSRNDANKAKRTKKPGRKKITFRHLNYCRHIVQYAVICPDLRIVQFFPVDHTGRDGKGQPDLLAVVLEGYRLCAALGGFSRLQVDLRCNFSSSCTRTVTRRSPFLPPLLPGWPMPV